MLRIRTAKTEHDFDRARTLFRAYAEALDFDLCFQDFEEELAALPGKYAPPQGALLLAERGGEVAGCVALRPLETDFLEGGVCEMKRLYVRPAHRGRGVGQSLAEAIIEAARERGYDVMRLDTVASMRAARALYVSLGFEETEPYYANPLADVVYMQRSLQPLPSSPD